MTHARNAKLPIMTIVASMLVLLALALAGCSSQQTAASAETTSKEAAGESVTTQEASQTQDQPAGEQSPSSSTASSDPYASGIHHATIEVEDYGTIELVLDANTAPITVANFCKLANEGFYDGITFHRIIPGFMIQGGDPTGTGRGGSDQRIPGEFAENGVPNPITHVRGTVSMARAGDPNSASSQFFIVHADSTHLDGKYAGFGHVTSGMDVVDAICEATPVQDKNGTVDPADQPRIAKVTIVD